MISMRYHAISIAAVFLALAVGVVLGASGLSDRLLSAVSAQRDDLGTQVTRLTAERDALVAQQGAADQFAARVGPAAVSGLLANKTVALVDAGGSRADADAVADLVGQAGGKVTGTVALTDAVGDPARADQLNELTSRLLPAGAQLPAASDTGSLVGGLLSGVLVKGGGQVTPDQATAVLSGLTGAGFVTPGTAPQPADLVVVLTGGALEGVDAGDAAAVTARLAAQLDRSGAGAVLAGREGSAGSTGPVGVARADGPSTAGLSTIDDVQTGSGRVATVLALKEQLDGKAGSYGSAENAKGGAAPGV
ncbi:copper transporter [Pseudonocardia sp.]|uniref:copper transporter n=1 Tax=Pseudonocardia sp. TaxID=60912 RepID=UPI0026277D56|nr:copper transporter [Pseudonocardia sp.]